MTLQNILENYSTGFFYFGGVNKIKLKKCLNPTNKMKIYQSEFQHSFF